MTRAFGAVECAIALVLIALATWGMATTMVRRAAPPPPWLHPAAAVWT